MNEQQQQHQQQRKGEKISVVAHKNANDYFMIFSVEKSEFENILKRPTDYNIFASVLYAAHFSWPKMEQNGNGNMRKPLYYECIWFQYS